MATAAGDESVWPSPGFKSGVTSEPVNVFNNGWKRIRTLGSDVRLGVRLSDASSSRKDFLGVGLVNKQDSFICEPIELWYRYTTSHTAIQYGNTVRLESRQVDWVLSLAYMCVVRRMACVVVILCCSQSWWVQYWCNASFISVGSLSPGRDISNREK
jgi:hypothetical protein